MKQPYKFWTREKLYWHLIEQAGEYFANDDNMQFVIKNAVYDARWNPLEDFNGCTFVQDPLHPFLPCFIHDWRWVTRQDIKASNIEFKDNLIKFGFTSFKAQLYYIGVTLGYYCYYQFKHKR